jgi:hypothetical protein
MGADLAVNKFGASHHKMQERDRRAERKSKGFSYRRIKSRVRIALEGPGLNLL